GARRVRSARPGLPPRRRLPRPREPHPPSPGVRRAGGRSGQDRRPGAPRDRTAADRELRRWRCAPVSHGHVHAPGELAESARPGAGGPPRFERVLELGAVLLLSLTTVATAWSGYQAARWSGEQSRHFARASTVRIAAQRETTAAGQLRIDDLL